MNESYCNTLAIQDYNQYRISCPPYQIIPYEYQGWFLLTFVLIAGILTLYILYLMMTGDKPWKENQKSEK